jgi:hypothetical protein
MGLILLVLLLALILGGLGFAIHILWWIALIVLVVWLLGFLIRVGEGAGRGRWYRWLPGGEARPVRWFNRGQARPVRRSAEAGRDRFAGQQRPDAPAPDGHDACASRAQTAKCAVVAVPVRPATAGHDERLALDPDRRPGRPDAPHEDWPPLGTVTAVGMPTAHVLACVGAPSRTPVMTSANITGTSTRAARVGPGRSHHRRLRRAASDSMPTGSPALSLVKIANMAAKWGSLALSAPSMRSSTRCWQAGKPMPDLPSSYGDSRWPSPRIRGYETPSGRV